MADIIFFRHWPAKYEVLKQDSDKKTFNTKQFLEVFSNVVDLKSTKEVEEFIKDLVKRLDFSKYKKIHIWVSPFWRTIETAKFIIKNLEQHWVDVKKVHLFETIEEVRNFHRDIHQALCNWGKIKKNWREIYVDKTKTNPKNLPFSEYFFNDEVKNIDKKYLEEIWLLDYVEKVEKYEEIVKRSFKVLDRLLKSVSEDKLVIIVTHQAFTDEIIRRKRDYSKDWWLEPGEYLIVKWDINNAERWKDFRKT